MECAEIRREFLIGRTPAGPAVEAHLEGCAHCRELFENGGELGRRLAQAAPPPAEAGDLFALVQRDLERESGVGARLRALPTSVRSSALVGCGLLLFVSQLAFRRRPDFSEFSPAIFWGVAAVLGLALAVASSRLLRGVSAPLAASAPQRWLGGALLVLPFLAALLVPWAAAAPELASGWGRPQWCFAYGAVLILPFLLLYRLFERREHVPLSVRISAGALSGIAANLLLHAHCPSAHLGHLLLGHASIGVAWAIALAALPEPAQRAR